MSLFLTQTKNLQYYSTFFGLLATFNFNFRDYQYLKVFYSVCNFFFEKSGPYERKDALSLFLSCFHSSLDLDESSELTKKQIEKLKAIILRILLEYPINEFFYDPIIGQTPRKRKITVMDSKSSISDFNFNDGSQDNITLNTNPLGSTNNLKDSTTENSPLEEMSLNKSEDLAASVSGIRLSIDMEMDEPKPENVQNEINKNVVKFFSNGSSENLMSIYEKDNFESFLYKIASQFYKCSDYSFKSVMTTIFENNNAIIIPIKDKMYFVLKCKNYDDLALTMQNYINLSFFNKETHNQFKIILQIFENNKEYLGNISYEIILYLLVQIISARTQNHCVFNHFVTSKYICPRIFQLAFENNKEATNSILKEFPKIIKFTLPYIKKCFVFDFVYEITSNVKTAHLGQVLINHILLMDYPYQDNKYYYLNKLNIVLMLYKISFLDDIFKSCSLDLSKKGLMDLFDQNLVCSKKDIFENTKSTKKKTYIDTLFKILVNLGLKTKNKTYIEVILEFFTSSNFYYNLDKKYYNEKNLVIQNYFKNYANVEIPSFAIHYLIKALKKDKNETREDLKPAYRNIINTCVEDLRLLMKETSGFHLFMSLKNIRNKLPEKNNLKGKIYNAFKKELETNLLNLVTNETNIDAKFNVILEANNQLNNSGLKYSKTSIFDTPKKFNPDLDSSFILCNSPKEIRSICKSSSQRKFKNAIAVFNREKKILNEVFDSTKDNSYEQIMVDTLKKGNSALIENKTNLIIGGTTNTLNEKLKNYFDFESITSTKDYMLFPKRTLIQQRLALFFTEDLFYDEFFTKMQKYYKYNFENVQNNGIEQKISIDNFLKYPSIIKNYTPEYLYLNGIFLKKDFEFFQSPFFDISHSYFIDKKNEYLKTHKRLFKKISEDEFLRYLAFTNLNKTKEQRFDCELISPKNVIFGEIIVTKHLIYFHDVDKEKKFSKLISEEEKEFFLLSSLKSSYVIRKKKLYLFIKDIREILNRRFLHQFQACEVFMKNGKNYFFNFFSEDKKREFFSVLSSINSNIKNKVITDLKGCFKQREYTKNWINNKTSNLAYLLYINKFSCRSYNDTSQYPVIPWVKLPNGNIRDLKYTIEAQDEMKREMLLIKYEESDPKYKKHYFLLYSNASFVQYYLIRLSPFTEEQIKLQEGKFEEGNRQFGSLTDLFKALNLSHETRELIPAFFSSIEFCFNYNCNFFGFKRKDNLIVHNLELPNNIDPFIYVCEHLAIINSVQTREKLNMFIDSVFGAGQFGNKESFNVYPKYSYQELYNFRDKIIKYKEMKKTFQEIKEKIYVKIDTIMNFGQIPYKIFEEFHPKYEVKPVNPKESAEKDKKNKNKFKDTQGNIICIKLSKNLAGKEVVYCLLKDFKTKECCFKFYDINLQDMKNMNPLEIPSRIKFLQKISIFGDRYKCAYRYNPQYIFIDFNVSLFVIGHLADNSILLLSIKGDHYNILTDSFVTTIIKVEKNSFITGHENGKIIQWKLKGKNFEEVKNLSDEKIHIKRQYLAHKKAVQLVEYNHQLNVLITSGEDKMLYIRKFYDFEMLAYFDLKSNICLQIDWYNCFLYALVYDEKRDVEKIKVLSMNGLLLYESVEGKFNSLYIDHFGNVLLGEYYDNKILMFNCSLNEIKNCIYPKNEKIESLRESTTSNLKLSEVKVGHTRVNSQDISSSSKEGNLSLKKYYTTEMISLMGFKYLDNTNEIFCIFSNGVLTKQKFTIE